MDSHPKLRSFIGGVLMVVGFLVWIVSQSHGCDLKSLWLELPLLLCFLIVIPAWATRAGGPFVMRTVGAVVLVIGLQVGYLSWLHSDYFPRWLLFPRPRIHHRAPNHSAEGKAGRKLPLTIGHYWPSLPEPTMGGEPIVRMTATLTSSQMTYLYNESLDLLRGDKVARDLKRAFSLNADAAKGGHADAVLAMGWFYLNGVGTSRDIEKAKKWYRESARRGEPKAMFSLGQIDYDERDFYDALRWFTRASEAGHVRSLFWLGKLYWRGHGVERDQKQAKRLFHQAASRKVPEAQRLLRFWT